jgi:hypothetical protein
LPSAGHKKKLMSLKLPRDDELADHDVDQGSFFFPILLGSQLVIIHKKI